MSQALSFAGLFAGILAGGLFCSGSPAAELETRREEPGVQRALDDPRAPLEGYLVGPPWIPPLGLPPRGVHPCASDVGEARARLAAFFDSAYPDAVRSRDERAGRPPRVNFEELAVAIARARVAKRPLTFDLELDRIGAIFAEEIRNGRWGTNRHLERWYILRCDGFRYVNSSYGVTFRPKTEPFDVPVEDPSALKLAQLGRSPATPSELEDMVDFFYRMGRVPLRGFNQRGELVGRGSLEAEGLFIVEDTVRWTLFDDAIVPGEPPTPPWVSAWVHVFFYDPATRELGHAAFIVNEPKRVGAVFTVRSHHVALDLIIVDRLENDRPYAAIRFPRDGLVFEDRARRGTVSFTGAASHAREMLSPDRMSWRSDRDGPLGHGLAIAVDLKELSSGLHELTFQVCDSRDRCGEATSSIAVP